MWDCLEATEIEVDLSLIYRLVALEGAFCDWSGQIHNMHAQATGIVGRMTWQGF